MELEFDEEEVAGYKESVYRFSGLRRKIFWKVPKTVKKYMKFFEISSALAMELDFDEEEVARYKVSSAGMARVKRAASFKC